MSGQDIKQPLLSQDIKEGDKPLMLNQSLKQSIDEPAHGSPSIVKNEVEPIRQEIPEEQGQEKIKQPDSLVSEQIPIQFREHEERKIQVAEMSEQVQRNRPEIASSITTEPDQFITKRQRRYNVMFICGIVCTFIGVFLILAVPPFLERLIVGQAIDQVIMTSQNQGQWAHFPGDTGTEIIRNFTFFKLLNEDDFLLRNHKPAFQQIGGFKIEELEDFLNITYLEDGNKVKVRDWLRFGQWHQSRDLDEVVTVLNLGNIGYWSTLSTARPTLILQQGMALLITGMQESIIPTLLGQGINSQFLPNRTVAVDSLLLPSGVEPQNLDFLWSDPSFGLYSPQNLGEWVQAALASFNNSQQSYQYSDQANNLKNYFVLQDSQLQLLMKKFYSYTVNLKYLLVDNHYCANISKSACTGRYLAMNQLTSGWVTAKPPPVSTISPNDTICDNNNTCKGYYPQLFAYQKNVYWGGKVNQSQITFDIQTVSNWFDYNKTVTKGVNFNTAQDCLMHIGNLDQIWQWGTDFDNGRDPKGIDKIGQRLKIGSNSQATVVWSWLKYLAKQFVLQKQKNDKLGMSNLYAQGFYQQFALLQDKLQPFLLRKMVQSQIVQCHFFFQNTLEEPQGSALVSSLCKKYTDVRSDLFLNFIVDTCEKKYGDAWQELRGQGVSMVAMEYHCQNNGGQNLGSMLHEAKVSLNSHYNCSSTPKPYCSNFQLAAKQWKNSQVTMNIPSSLKSTLNKTDTFHKWDKSVKAFEYGFFLNKFTEEQKKVFPKFDIDQLFSLFTFEQWFSAPVILKHVIKKEFGDNFIRYIRWFAISVTLNGFTMDRTVRQILFGYQDQFLRDIKNTYPPFGGDPSAPSFIALNELNLTQHEASQTIVFKTGKDNFRDVYQNYQIDGYQYFVNNYTWFTGNQTVWQWKTPWKENDYFYGTTAKIFAPNQFEADNLSLLIPQVQRYGSNFFHNESYLKPRYGIDLYISYLSEYIGEVAPHNDKYYQTLPNVFNVSSIYGLPLYATKNHFLNCTQWLQKIDIYSQDMSIKYEEVSSWDDSFILVQPYTGVSFQSVVYLQNNYYHQPDFLYTYPNNTMLPIFSISRGGNLTQDKFHELFDPLVIGLAAKSVIIYIGIAFVVVFLIMTAISLYFKKKLKKERKQLKDTQLGISLQEVRQNEDAQDRLTLQRED